MFKRILVPVDGSEPSNKALVAALQIARDAGGQVRLLHAIDEIGMYGAIEAYYLNADALMKNARDAGNRILQDARAIAESAGVPVETHLAESFDQPLDLAVNAQALAWPADMVVIGSHGRRGLGRLLLGSGAERIARSSPVPVLIIPTGRVTAPDAP